MTLAPADTVRAHVAALLAPDHPAPEAIGAVALYPHQRSAVARVEAAMREFGGALLADETGLGKTFIALTLARTADHPIVVAPAALRDMWLSAARSAETAIELVSTEALSRSAGCNTAEPDLVIVDECHHFRNPATARHRALARLTERARVLLLSATPVHNSPDDLAALLSLFLGTRASVLDPAWTSRCIVRRATHDVLTARLPHVPAAELLRVAHDEQHLDALLALPPPIPPADGGDGGALLVYSLVRQWASSRAALTGALRRRLARATALLAGLEIGRHPSAAELTAWSFADGAVQLAFPELVIDAAQSTPGAVDLTACVRAHADAVSALLNDLASTPDPDSERAHHLSALRARHRGERIVVFSQYADTIDGIFRALGNQSGVAALTADGGRIAGGRLSRNEALGRFSPHSQQAPDPPPAERVDLLLTTDLLSEGVNLQDASVLVHLDMPWTPARLDQRVGRIARLGSAHERVSIYAFVPPAGAERLVQVERRLRDKLRVATRTVGLAGTIIPSLAPPDPLSTAEPSRGGIVSSENSPAELSEGIHALLARWRRPPVVALRADSGRLVAAVRCSHTGFLAAIGDSTRPRLLADVGAGPTDDPSALLAAMRAAGGDDAVAQADKLSRALRAIERWSAATRTHRELSVDGALRAQARRSVVDRIAAITRRAPRHLRPAIAALAATARRTASAPFGAGAERVLGELASAPMPDEAWLRAVSAFGTIHAAAAEPGSGADQVLAVVLFVNESAASGSPRSPG